MGKRFASRKADREFWHDFDREFVQVKMVEVTFGGYEDNFSIVVDIRHPIIDDYHWLVSEAKRMLRESCYIEIDNGPFDTEPKLRWYDGKRWSGKIAVPLRMVDGIVEFDEDEPPYAS